MTALEKDAAERAKARKENEALANGKLSGAILHTGVTGSACEPAVAEAPGFSLRSSRDDETPEGGSVSSGRACYRANEFVLLHTIIYKNGPVS